MFIQSIRFAMRSLLSRPLRSALTLFGIVFGVAVILAISITNRSAMATIMTVFNETSGKAHLVVTSATSAEGLPEGASRRSAALAGVQVAVPIVQAQSALADSQEGGQVDLRSFGSMTVGLLIYGIIPAQDSLVREYQLVDGRFLDAGEKAYEIVLVKSFAEDKDIAVGQDVAIRTPMGVESLRVVGLIAREGAGKLNNGAFGVVPLATVQDVFGRGTDIDQIDIVAQPGSDDTRSLDLLKEELQARLGDGYLVTYPAARGRRVAQMLDGYQIGLSMFSAIALFVGAFLIFNTFSMTVVERTREIGMTRALGMTRQQVMLQILAEASILAASGVIVGVGAGLLLSRGLTQVMALMLAQEVQSVPVPIIEGVLPSVLVGVVVTLLAASIPAWQASRISPLEALRVRSQERRNWFIERGWMAGLGLLFLSLAFYALPINSARQSGLQSLGVLGLLLSGVLLIPATVNVWHRVLRGGIGKVYGNEGRIGSGNIERSKSRTTLTVAALMIGVAMVLSIRAISDAFATDITDWMEKYVGGDLLVTSDVAMRPDLARGLEAMPGVQAVTPIRYFDVTLRTGPSDAEEIAFAAIEPETYTAVTGYTFAADQGDPKALMEQLARGDSVFVSSILAEQHGLKQGDDIYLETRRGRQAFNVAATIVDYFNQGLVIHGSWRDMRRYFGHNDVSAFLVKLQPGYLYADVAQRLDDLYATRRHLTIESNEGLRNQASGLLAQTSIMFDVLALIAMIVAAFGIVNTLTMNVLERTREIGMLRSLGMTRWQIGKMLLAEAGTMGVIGGVFGLVFGLLLSRTLLDSINAMTGYGLSFVLPVDGIIVGLVLSLVVSQLAALWPARRAARLRIIDAIQFE
jgi:putative ABC transport system permease protein